MVESLEAERKKPSRLWYLLPIFLNIIGGVIGYFLLKDKNRKFAERLLIVGLVMIAVWWGLSFLLSAVAYWYISGVFTAKTASVIEMVDASCSAGSHSIIVRNVGTQSISSNNIAVSIDGTSASCVWSGNLNPGSSATCTTSTSVTSGSHRIRITGPTNVISGTDFCT